MFSMKKKRNLSKEFFHARILFDRKDFEQIKAAAIRRGLSHQAFVRMACNFAAAKVMSRPADDVLGFGDVSPTSSTRENAA